MFDADRLPPLREVVGRFDIAAQKSLGQHFLFDLNLTRRIASAAGDVAGQNVIEIGAGPGGLTRALLETGAQHVYAGNATRAPWQHFATSPSTRTAA